MKFLFKWLNKKIQQSNYDEDLHVKERQYDNVLTSNAVIRREIDCNSLNFKIYKASGGTVLETSSYDRKTDRHNNSLYIITDSQDLGKEIGKIITLESLRS
jgi:hypothetical protein